MQNNEIDLETLGLLRESFERYGAEKYTFDLRKAGLREEARFSREAWAEYAAMGWLSMPVSIEQGGFDSDPAAVASLMQFVGERLALEPVFASVVLCGRLLALAGPGPISTAALQSLAEGSAVFALAHAENLGDGMNGPVRSSCVDGKLSGRKVIVLHGDQADRLIVTAVDASSGRTGLFIADTTLPGVRVKPYALLDGRGAASFEFNDVRVTTLGRVEDGESHLTQALEEARLALCSEAYGAIKALNAMTLAYLKERKQFGRTVGTNQALQHRMVESYMLEEEVRAVTALAHASTNGDVRRQAVFAAVAHTIEAGRRISNEAIQMHGGIGITEELSVSHYFRRLMVINHLLGDRQYHVDEFAGLRH